MSLRNQNWITFGGEPVTGRTPTQIRVFAEPPGLTMTAEQQGFVARAYKLFCDAVNVSAFPNGYHVQNRTAPDGTTVRMESNTGVHRVFVKIKGGDEVEVDPSGIGVMVCYTNNALIPSYTMPRSGKASIAQPLILRPNDKGAWKVEKVTYLAGGQAMWVSQDRKEWFSINSTLMPGGSGFYYSPRLVSEQIRYFNSDWTPESNDRISTSDYLGRIYALGGRYVYRRNEAITFLAEPYGSPPFVHKSPQYGKLMYHVSLDNWGAQVYVSRLKESEGLRSPDGTAYPYIGEEVDDVPDFPNSYYLSSPRRMSPATAAFSPAGDKVTVLGFQQGGASDYLVTINFDGPNATISESSAGVETVDMQSSGQISCVGSATRSFSIRTSTDPAENLYTSCDGTQVARKWEVKSQTNLSTITADYSGQRTETYLNRPYIDAAGETQLEVFSDHRTVQGNCTATVSDGRDGDWEGDYERIITNISTGTTTSAQTLSGPGYSIPLGETKVSITINSTQQVRSSATVTPNHSIEVECTNSISTHHLLYWDVVLGVRLEYRVFAGYTMSGVMAASGRSDFLQSQLDEITTKSLASGQLVLVRGDTEIQLASFAGAADYTVTLSLPVWNLQGTTNNVMDPLNNANSSWLLGFTPAYSAQIYGLTEAPTLNFTSMVAEKAQPTIYYLSPCNLPAQSPPDQWADIPYSNLNFTQSKAAKDDEMSFNAAGTLFTGNLREPAPTGIPSASDFYVQYARDPKTDAIVLSARHPNSGQSWMYGVTKQGVQDLRDILKLPLSAQIKLDSTFPFNNLVSI